MLHKDDLLRRYTKRSLKLALNNIASSHAIEVLEGLLQYDPNKRIDPMRALKLKFFDPVRNLAKLQNFLQCERNALEELD
jgi:hypothetical protein